MARARVERVISAVAISFGTESGLDEDAPRRQRALLGMYLHQCELGSSMKIRKVS
jgi:hypothetical protein